MQEMFGDVSQLALDDRLVEPLGEDVGEPVAGWSFDEVLELLDHLDGLLGHKRVSGLAKETHPKARECWEAREAARIAAAVG